MSEQGTDPAHRHPHREISAERAANIAGRTLVTPFAMPIGDWQCRIAYCDVIRRSRQTSPQAQVEQQIGAFQAATEGNSSIAVRTVGTALERLLRLAIDAQA